MALALRYENTSRALMKKHLPFGMSMLNFHYLPRKVETSEISDQLNQMVLDVDMKQSLNSYFLFHSFWIHTSSKDRLDVSAEKEKESLSLINWGHIVNKNPFRMIYDDTNYKLDLNRLYEWYSIFLLRMKKDVAILEIHAA